VSWPAKLSDLLLRVRGCVEEGRYLDTCHASERQEQRSITRSEVLQVLKRGYHERKRDRFEELHGSWNYSIRGKTVDGRDIRVIVSFEEDGLVIITAIEVGK